MKQSKLRILALITMLTLSPLAFANQSYHKISILRDSGECLLVTKKINPASQSEEKVAHITQPEIDSSYGKQCEITFNRKSFQEQYGEMCHLTSFYEAPLGKPQRDTAQYRVKGDTISFVIWTLNGVDYHCYKL